MTADVLHTACGKAATPRFIQPVLLASTRPPANRAPVADSAAPPATQDPSRSSGAAFAARVERDKADRDKARTLRPLRVLWPYVARYPGWLALFLLFLALSSAATLALPGILRVITDCGFGDGTAEFCRNLAASPVGEATGEGLGGYFRIALAFAVVFAVVGALRFYFVTVLGQRVVSDIRNAVYSHLVTLSPEWFERTRTGEVLSRLTTDTTLVETVVTGSVSFAIRAVVTAVGSIVLMFLVSWKLALLVLAIGPFIVLPIVLVGKRLRTLSREGQDRLADASARAGEAVGSIQTVQAFTREGLERELFTGSIEAAFRTQRARIRLQSILTASLFAIGLGGMTAVLWVGARMVEAGSLTGGEIAAFLAYAFFTVSNASVLTETWTNLLRAAGASERLVDILQASPAVAPPALPAPLPDVRGEVSFDSVSFTYPTRPEAPALRDLAFHVAPGETVALVGPSGAGKSTVFQLLLRFYDPQAGTVCLDGHPVTELDPEVLRSHIAVVQQATPLFSGSAMDNIRYGRPDATDTEVVAAARAANAHDFLQALPDGYSTDIGERGTTLSGGQRQRIAIARAILRDAPVLLLDEATSALDAESERAVQDAFARMSENRTTLVIAHRLATVKEADRILVLDEGELVASGTHDALVAQGGLYARLAELQFA